MSEKPEFKYQPDRPLEPDEKLGDFDEPYRVRIGSRKPEDSTENDLGLSKDIETPKIGEVVGFIKQALHKKFGIAANSKDLVLADTVYDATSRLYEVLFMLDIQSKNLPDEIREKMDSQNLKPYLHYNFTGVRNGTFSLDLELRDEENFAEYEWKLATYDPKNQIFESR